MAPFHQQRNDDDPVGSVGCLEGTRAFGADHRVQDGFESVSGLRIGKDQTPHGCPIQRARAIDHLSAECRADRWHRRTVGRRQAVRNLIGIDDPRAQGGKRIGNGGFTTTDTPRQSDQRSCFHGWCAMGWCQVQSAKASQLGQGFTHIEHGDPRTGQIGAKGNRNLTPLPTTENQDQPDGRSDPGCE